MSDTYYFDQAEYDEYVLNRLAEHNREEDPAPLAGTEGDVRPGIQPSLAGDPLAAFEPSPDALLYLLAMKLGEAKANLALCVALMRKAFP